MKLGVAHFRCRHAATMGGMVVGGSLLALAAPTATSSGLSVRSEPAAGQSASSRSRDWAYALEMQRDGKIVVAGRSVTGHWRFALARYTTGGKLDASFGRGGKVSTEFGSSGHSAVSALAIQQDGKIVVAGRTRLSPLADEVAIGRYTARGSLDPRFGRSGEVLTEFGSGKGLSAWANALAIQLDGKLIVAGGSRNLVRGPVHFGLARYTRGGRLDPGFGRRGRVTTAFGPGAGGDAKAIATQRDGRILVAGPSDVRTVSRFALARYTAGGKLDPSFGNGGKVLTDFGSWSEAHAFAIQPDGELAVVVVAGFSDFALARYTPDGRLDRSFGSGGKVVTDFCPTECPGGYTSHEEAGAVAIQADGKIVVAGSSDVRNGEMDEFALVRYIADGHLDPTFGSDGKVLTRFGGYSTIEDLRIQADGKIVAAGGGAGYFALARYTANGHLDPTFGSGGRVMTHFR